MSTWFLGNPLNTLQDVKFHEAAPGYGQETFN